MGSMSGSAYMGYFNLLCSWSEARYQHLLSQVEKDETMPMVVILNLGHS